MEIPPLFKNQSLLLLYIEDNAVNLDLIRKVISYSPKTRMLSSPDAEQGIELARSHQPDVILMDINLPGMDGYDALRVLQTFEETRSIPVIGLSANAMQNDIEKAKTAGFKGYITKPINVSTFLTSIENILQSRND